MLHALDTPHVIECIVVVVIVVVVVGCMLIHLSLYLYFLRPIGEG